jgi:hypothetical protein
VYGIFHHKRLFIIPSHFKVSEKSSVVFSISQIIQVLFLSVDQLYIFCIDFIKSNAQEEVFGINHPEL